MAKFTGFQQLMKRELTGKKVYASLSRDVGDLLDFITVDTTSEEVGFRYKFPSKLVKAFVDELVLDKNIFQAMVLSIFDLDIKETGYQSRYEFRTAFKAKLSQLQIPNYFICEPDAVHSTFLLASDINLQNDETVLMVANFNIAIKLAELKLTSNGYKYRQKGSVNTNQKPGEISKQILDYTNPKKIIVGNVDDGNPLLKFLKSEKLISIGSNAGNYFGKFIVETCKWILDKRNAKYHILPVYDREIELCVGYGLDDKSCDTLNYFDADVGIPCSYSNDFPRTVLQCLVIFDKEHKYRFDKHLDLDRNGCHRFEANFSVDAETLESFNVQKITIDSIRKLPYHLEDVCDDSKVPVIGLFDNSSVILTHKGCLGYDFLKSWNGLYGKNLFMSFDQKKQTYFQEAWTKLEDKRSFVIFDLLQIMSIPPDEIESSASWGFKIIKDAENPILLEFDTFDGSRKAASPSFLMAMFIRKHLKAVQEENGGEKPEEIAFWILNELNGEEQFDEDEMKRIKEGLEEACKLLKISCSYVDC